ncbi:pantoate--beta-alanine ligase [Nocardioides pocheonensis]|uniref:pantoate--beta-alanine ligase n=1 Tax=Nocardioides pocheonensis TaxID=661485 RepID=UPI001FE9FD18|nr:pantoate--beta-alanine ligase [Nocardioides pocheonensis]
MTTTLQRADTRVELDRALAGRTGGARVAFVPTMGALHDGHVSLMRCAREIVGPDGAVVVSVFVNPTQFGPGEDLDRYPRTLETDLEACAAAGVDVVFTPSVDEVYPGGLEAAARGVTVDPGPLADVLEGASRPGHFRGVLTVVAKLFGLVRPDVSVFGEKDYQQLALIRRMAADLCLGVDVVGAPTVREPDGLAMSSRNRYLDTDARLDAVALSRALFAARAEAERGAEWALSAARAELRRTHLVDLDYLEITAPDLGPAPEHGPARMLVAARVGSTRLIDNIALDLGPSTGRVVEPAETTGE